MPSLSQSTFPWLVYAYPWMPFPRRISIYLRERQIPESLVTIVHVRDPQQGDNVVDDKRYPARPKGSLPILAIPQTSADGTNEQEWIHVTQSLGIISLIEELCLTGQYNFPRMMITTGSDGGDLISRARETGLIALADSLTVMWNPVRTFGTGAGTMSLPSAAKDQLGWVRRTLHAFEVEYKDRKPLSVGDRVPISEIVLFQFLEFTCDCYGVNMTIGTGKATTDPYGRPIKDEYPNLVKFYAEFKARESAKRYEDKGECPGEKAKAAMTKWAEGVL